MNNTQIAPFTILDADGPKPWYLDNIPLTWTKSQGEDITVFVLDSGLPNHPDLKDNIVGHINCVSGEPVDDLNGHSTAVCGVVQAIAPKCKIVIVKVMDKNGIGDFSSLLKGFGYVSTASSGIDTFFPDLIVCSLGSSRPLPDFIHTQIKNIYNAGVPIICAAGNSGNRGVDYPAAYNECIAIAAYDEKKNIANFSGRGGQVDFACPGKGITTTWLNGEYKTVNGTSFAAPFCGGVVALMLSKHRKQEIETGTNDCTNILHIKQHLAKYAIDAGKKGHDREFGHGIIDPFQTVMDDSELLPPLQEETKEGPPTLFGAILNWFRK